MGQCAPAQAGQGPLKSRIPANLRANFSPHYLAQKVDGRTRAEVSAVAVLHLLHNYMHCSGRGLSELSAESMRWTTHCMACSPLHAFVGNSSSNDVPK